MKKSKSLSTMVEFTRLGKVRQKCGVLQPRGPFLFSRASVRSLPRLPGRPRSAVFSIGSLSFPCAIGRSGIGVKRREGDGFTPAGRLTILYWLQRHDRWRPIRPNGRAIRQNDSWCDDPKSYSYNYPTPFPFRASSENLWRDDGVYDVIGVLDFNRRPRILGRGSAIFLHLAHPDFRNTAGCIALPRPVMRRIQNLWREKLQVDVGNCSRRLRSPKIADPTRT